MRIVRAKIENFRLLRNVEIGFEDCTTVIVGRNNSGKASIAELFRRLLSGNGPTFRLEDFSLGCHESFWLALQAYRADPQSRDVLGQLPSIRLILDIEYDTAAPDLGPLGDCIIDLNEECHEVRLEFRFGPKATASDTFFQDHVVPIDNADDDRSRFFRDLSQRLPTAYAGSLEAVDPNDATNRKVLETKLLTTLIGGGFINAQRGLDDDTMRERDVLGTVVGNRQGDRNSWGHNSSGFVRHYSRSNLVRMTKRTPFVMDGSFPGG